MTLLLVPSSPLRPRLPDPHFAEEYRAARELGADVAVVDHDQLEAGAAAAAVRSLPVSADVVYRGWMLRSEQYAGLAGALAEQGSLLRTTPDQYRTAHELPGWAAALTGLTPDSIWSVGPELVGLEQLRTSWGDGRAVLRDYTKSMKHHWDEAMYLPDLADPAAVRRVGARFVELREDAFTGGFVLRRFEDFIGDEVRTWWVYGECVLVTPHPDTPGEPPEVDLTPFAPAIAALGLPFVTVDLALRADGSPADRGTRRRAGQRPAAAHPRPRPGRRPPPPLTPNRTRPGLTCGGLSVAPPACRDGQVTSTPGREPGQGVR